MSDVSNEAVKTFQEQTNEASARFFAMMQNRHDMGEQKYGPIKFMEVNTLEEAMEEVVDLANYAMYTFMKLYILNAQTQRVVGDNVVDPLGAASFMRSGE
jgi:hypothetical protein